MNLPAPHPPDRSDGSTQHTFWVPWMLVASSAIMALAWLGHIRFKDDLPLITATLLAWLLVLPEYGLNIGALRMGYGRYTGGQMAAFRLCSGVVWIAIVSRFILGEPLTSFKLLGFGLMCVAMWLISSSQAHPGTLSTEEEA